MCLLQCSSAPMLIAAMLIRVPALCVASSRRSATLANFPVGHGRVRVRGGALATVAVPWLAG